MNILKEFGFKSVWVADFEFQAPPGETPAPVCLVAQEIFSGNKVRIFQDELYSLKTPPYSITEDSLFIAYYSSADHGCHLALKWPLPANVLDPFVEFRNLTNGRKLQVGSGLLGALAYFGLDGLGAIEKDEMRKLVMRGGPWSLSEQVAILEYCESDVQAIIKLLPKLLPYIDIRQALLRGRFMKAAARIERNGIPVDKESLLKIKDHWPLIKKELIEKIDAEYQVFEECTFKTRRFEEYLIKNDIPWPRLPSGALALDDETFKEMSRTYSKLAPLRELRVSLSKMRNFDLQVGNDCRNRYLLSAFQSRTSRNQPSSSKSIYGTSVWLRELIRPKAGYALAYIDWSQQEFGIAAALSGDEKMIEAYRSGDPYLALAKQTGAVPPEGTKESHSEIREQFKTCMLAVQYGMSHLSLAMRLGKSPAYARNLLRMLREAYPKFWQWSDSAVDHAMLHGFLCTSFGWKIHVGSDTNPRFLRNFPMQANGAEMLRLACCLITENDICVCAPVHDAILIEAPITKIEDTTIEAQKLMEEASSIVLNGHKLRSDAKIILYPHRYVDQRGEKMWQTVWELVNKKIQREPLPTDSTPGDHGRTPAPSYLKSLYRK